MASWLAVGTRSRALRKGTAAVALALALPLAASAPAALAVVPTTTRASLSSSGVQADADSVEAGVSDDGRYVTFRSGATNLVPGDTNGQYDVFVRDRLLGATTRVDLGPGGAQADQATYDPAISADGRTVVFSSTATTLDTPATTGYHVYAWNRVTGALRRLDPALPAPYTQSLDPAVSADGSRIAFTGWDGGTRYDVFVVDGAGTPRRVSEASPGTGGNGRSLSPDLSSDGRWLVWQTAATDLVPGDTDANGKDDVVAQDLTTGARARISLGAGGGELNNAAVSPVADGTGCRFAFRSSATNVVSGVNTALSRAYLRDRCAGTTEVLSRPTSGDTTGNALGRPSLSDDGCLAVFATSDGVVPVTAGSLALALRDRCNGRTSRIDVSSENVVPTTGGPNTAAISGSGRYVAFDHTSPDLVTGDTNGHDDVFVRDLGTNAPPTAALTVTGDGGATFHADASASGDADGPRITGQISWGDGTPPDTGLQATHTYTRAGPATVTVTITDSDGATATATRVVTVPAPPAEQPTPPIGTAPPPGSGTPAARPLVLDRVALSHRRFGVVTRGSTITATRGTRLTLRLSADATVRLVFRSVRPGRRAGSRCVAGRRTGRRCTLVTTVATRTVRLAAGTRTVALTGRVGSRRLPVGAGRLEVQATDAEGRRSAVRRVDYTITNGR